MNYSPNGMVVWDAWYVSEGNRVHMYHLQRSRKALPPAQPDPLQDALAHAVSEDMIDWREQDVVLKPDPMNPDDNMQPWTGCALRQAGETYLFYTMRGTATSGKEQGIGLAKARNFQNFARVPQNPVLVPDGRFYANTTRPVPGVIDCRDMHVVSDGQGGWFGFFATRVPGRELVETSAIGLAFSRDLVRWEQRAPAFVPRRYACIEVPDVFFLNGKWYMLLLTGNFYGNRGCWSDASLTHGTIYAVAEKLEGPYVEIGDNALIASAVGPAPISARSLRFEGELYVLYTDRERRDRTDNGAEMFGTVTTPKLLKSSGDELRACYSPRIESRTRGILFRSGENDIQSQLSTWGQIWRMPGAEWLINGATIQGKYATAWSILPISAGAQSFIFEASISVDAVAAGCALRMGENREGAVVMLDTHEREVVFSEVPAFEFSQRRRVGLERSRTYHLRVVQRLEHIEIYLDHALKLAFPRYKGLGGGFGLFVDRGMARFSGVVLHSLEVSPPC